jgi:hypothetical protein
MEVRVLLAGRLVIQGGQINVPLPYLPQSVPIPELAPPHLLFIARPHARLLLILLLGR